jgi:hypothetical protein
MIFDKLINGLGGLGNLGGRGGRGSFGILGGYSDGAPRATQRAAARDAARGMTRADAKIELDERILALNNIHVLTIDERWNSLFVGVERTPEIECLEDAQNQRLKDQARLICEQKENCSDKKVFLARIMELTEEAFAKENAAARCEIDSCEAKVRQINARELEITEELAVIDGAIRAGNLGLLERVANLLYPGIRNAQLRIAELEAEIEALRDKLKSDITEKETLAATYDDAYNLMHSLLGADQIESLDRHFSI